MPDGGKHPTTRELVEQSIKDREERSTRALIEDAIKAREEKSSTSPPPERPSTETRIPKEPAEGTDPSVDLSTMAGRIAAFEGEGGQREGSPFARGVGLRDPAGPVIGAVQVPTRISGAIATEVTGAERKLLERLGVSGRIADPFDIADETIIDRLVACRWQRPLHHPYLGQPNCISFSRLAVRASLRSHALGLPKSIETGDACHLESVVLAWVRLRL